MEGSFIKLSVRMKCVRDFSDTYWDGRDDDDVGEEEIKKLSRNKNTQQPTNFPEIFRPRHSYFFHENCLKSTLFFLSTVSGSSTECLLEKYAARRGFDVFLCKIALKIL